MRFWTFLRGLSTTHPTAWSLSSSSKVYPPEVKEIFPAAASFFQQTKKLYLQVLEFRGDYQFKDDLLIDLNNLAPYPYKLPPPDFGAHTYFFEKFSADEIEDYCEAKPDSPMSKLWLAETRKKPTKKK